MPTVVDGAAEALQALGTANHRACQLPLVLTDAQMPEMDGFGLVERIRAGSVISPREDRDSHFGR